MSSFIRLLSTTRISHSATSSRVNRMPSQSPPRPGVWRIRSGQSQSLAIRTRGIDGSHPKEAFTEASPSELLLQVCHGLPPRGWMEPLRLQDLDGEGAVLEPDRIVDRRILQRKRNRKVPLHDTSRRPPVVTMVLLDLAGFHDVGVKRHDLLEYPGGHQQTMTDGKTIPGDEPLQPVVGLEEIVIVPQDHVDAVPF